MKTKTTHKVISIVALALIAALGLSFLIGNNKQTSIGNTLASAAAPADINSDGVVNIFDLSTLLSNWNKTGVNTSDINADSVVNIFDLSALLSKWGPVAGSQMLNCTPSPSATMTNTVSHLCGFPDTTNTGVPAATTLKRVPQDITAPDATTGSGWHYDSRGWISVDTNGAIIQNISTALNIDVTADNVTVQRVKIKTGNDMFGVSIRNANNVKIQDSEISGTDAGANRLMVAVKDIYSTCVNLQVLRNNIYYVSTGVQMDAGLIQDNYIHDMGYIDGDHLNGTTSNGGTGQLTIKHNTSLVSFSQTDAISLFQDFGAQANRLIDNNLVAGGGYTIYAGWGAGLVDTYNIKITNNHFSRLYYPNSGYWGPVTGYLATGTGNEWSGNIWDDTGTAVNP